MNQDEIIEMARQAGLTSKMFIAVQPKYTVLDPNIEAFAKLVAAKEREACAVIAEEWFCGCGRGGCPEGDRRAYDIADSIRERGEA